MRFKFIVLEERIVLDAALTMAVTPTLLHADIVDSHPANTLHSSEAISLPHAQDSFLTNPDAPASAGARVLVISSQIKDAQILANSVQAGVKVVLYDPTTTTLNSLYSQISKSLNGQLASSIAFATEGADGQFHLTSTEITSLNSLGNDHNLTVFWENLSQLVQSGGRVDILACDVAADSSGLQLIQDVQNLVDLSGRSITVAASTDLTGNPSAGGDWTLEVGNVDAQKTYFDSSLLTAWPDVMASITGTTVAFTSSQNVAFSNQLIAHMVDSDNNINPGSYNVTIHWGDGTQSAGTLTETSAGHFDVFGSHTYTTGGTKALSLNLTDTDGDTGIISGSVVVDYSLNANAIAVSNVIEGKAIGNGTTVANFTDNDPSPVTSDFTATIFWGDGSSSAGTIAKSGSSFNVNGGHTYSDEGTYGMFVVINDAKGATVTTSTVNNIAADAALGGATAHAVNSTEGTAISNFHVASFNDANPLATISDFSAVIHWGDGTTSAGTIVVNGGNFDVVGSHTYTDEGTYSMFVTINDVGGATVTTNSANNNIADAALTGVAIAGIAVQNEALPSDTVVAHFTDANPLATVSDYTTVTITWGDGATSAGTVVANPSGGFDVIGSHTYTIAPSQKDMSVQITDTGGSNLNTGKVKETIASPLSGSANPISAVEGIAMSANTIIAHFTDPDAVSEGDTAADYTATIHWGDGTTSTGTIVASAGGGFDVQGSHTYTDEGTFNSAYVFIVEQDTAKTAEALYTSNVTATVSDAPLTASGLAISGTEGSAISNVKVAHFTDANPNGALAEYSATIFWGDGTNSTGTISTNAGGGFDVFGSHTYIDEGNFNTMHIVINDIGGATVTTANSTASISDAALSGSNISFSPTEGIALASNTTVSHFSDANSGATPSDFTATIFWGDGTSSTGTVVANGGGFDVRGSHTYADEGTYSTMHVVVNDVGGSTLTTSNSSVAVADAALTATGSAISGTEGNALSNTTVAHFTDANPNSTASDFSATIFWGDGTSSAGTVSASVGGGFDVKGTHTYSDEGTFNTLHVAINDVGGATSTTSNATATIADAALSGAGIAISATEGLSLTSVKVAHFTDANPNGTASEYSATIFWGDGASSAGTVVASVGGGFDVLGSHTYAEEGALNTMHVVINDVGGATLTTANTTATVTDAALTASGSAISATEGAAIPSSTTVAHFTDADPAGTLTDYTATIFWGDGTSSAGTIVTNAGGGFDVQGGHTYAEEGSFNTMHVVINDAGGATVTTVNTTASVADAALTATANAISAVEGAATASNTVVAHFTDADPGGVVSDYTATIFWGDGTTSAGTIVTNAGGGFDVQGGHTYSEEGTYTTMHVVINDAGGATTSTANVNATVADATLTATANPLSAVEGAATANNTVVAHFTDADPGGVVTDYTATIFWGDGSSSAGTIVSNAGGGFDVQGSHTYAEEGTLSTMHVVINDAGGATITTANVNATVADAALTATTNPLSAVEGAAVANNTVIAHFTDADPAGAVSDYTATIFWGDGTSSAGTIVANVNGGFDVQGGHTYAEEGTFSTMHVVINDAGGATISTANVSATVADAALAATANSLSAVEGAAITNNTVVAHFTDADPAGVVSDYNATIFWGDGTSSAGTIVANAGGGFDVQGGHTYAEEGTFSTMHVVINDTGGATVTTANVSATVADAALAATSNAISAVEGAATANNTVVAHFTDADPGGVVSDYTATIFWGDGTNSSGTIVANAGGGFDVQGSHTYAEEGTFSTMHVVINDAGGANITTANVTATVADAALAATANSLSAVEGTAIANNTVVAHFTDADPAGVFSDYTATIFWGDGTSSSGTIITNAGGGFDVQGSHTYAEEGNFSTMHVVINDAGGATVTTANVSATVADAALAATANALSAVEGAAVGNNTVVAHFTDANPGGVVSDYTATIFWGDGTSSAGTVVANVNGGFDVQGGHTYAEEGTFSTMHVVINDAGGATVTSANVNATVADAALAATANALSAVEGAAIANNTVIAHFTDSDPAGSVSDYTATIFWGDGTSSAGTIVSNAGGGFDVQGGHTYAEEGTFSTMHVAINDTGGAMVTTANVSATVADAALAATANSISAVEGAATANNAVVAHFTDADPGGVVSDYTATIFWGDGTSSAGTIVANAGGGFDVQGGHTYAEEGTFTTMNVVINDAGGATVTTANVTATVADAALTASANALSAVEGSAIANNTVVAHFTDADPAGVFSDYTATIFWGDGTSSSGTIITNAGGGFDVQGSHTYAEEGNFTTMNVVINDAGGATVTTANVTATVTDAALAATANSISAVEGAAVANNTVVAHFTDADPGGVVSDYTATIFWGDGTSSAGTIVPNAGGGFDVQGGHTYAEEGTFTTMNVVINDAGGATVTSTNVTASVADAALTANAIAISAVEGAAIANNTVVAHFTDADPAGTVSDYTATIFWGDGTSSVGTVVSNAGGGFDIQGGHTYAEEGTFSTMHVAINDTGGATVTTINVSATVADAALTATANSISAVEGDAIDNNTVVAHFTDADPAGAVSDYTATIFWGDGTSSAGTIVANAGGGFDVQGGHTYAEEGTFTTMNVVINDAGGATVTTANVSATVSDAALTATANPLSAVEGAAIANNTVVAHFSDSDPAGVVSDYTAAIFWGDGSSSSGTIVANAGGGFDVQGGHTYAEEGTFSTMNVVINDTGGATVTTANVNATVADAALAATANSISAVEGAAIDNNTVVAHFTDADPGGIVSDYTATIFWGDGTSSAGTIVSNAGGGFDVQGGHTYAEEGTFTAMNVVINDTGGATVTTANVTANVADAALAATANPISAVEGAAIANNTVVAHFTDADPGGIVSDYTATIFWGDGTTSAGTIVSNAGGGFDVQGGHTYAEEGSFTTMHVVINDTGGATISTTNVSATVADAALSATGSAISAVEGSATANNTVVAHFTDADPNGISADYSATIFWGDGSNSAGTISVNANGGFDVLSAHTYAEEGSYNMHVIINDVGGATITTTDVINNVTDAALSATANPFSAVEGAAISNSQILAHFTDANPGATVSDYTVSIDWGDNTSSAGSVVANPNGGFDVLGVHTYQEEGSYNLNVTVLDTGGATVTSNNAPINVADATLSANAFAITGGVEGALISNSTVVSHFVDADPNGTVTDYTATITWGDGSTSSGLIVANANGGFDVLAGHTYSEEGTYNMHVMVQDAGGAAITTTDVTNVVNDAALSATANALNAVEGSSVPSNQIVAHFTDADPAGFVSSYNATIDWGDGTTTSGTVAANPNGGFDVIGGHTYVEEGSYNMHVAVNDVGGSIATADASNVVADAALSSTAFNLSAVEGTPTSGNTLIAHFDDANPFGTLSDFSATIAWGDNSTSTGTIVANPNGGFDVLSGHQYAEEGTFSVVVTIVDVGGATTITNTATATVADATLSATPSSIQSPVEGAAFANQIVAHFTDANPTGNVSDFSAMITWGDGTTSAGSIAANPNGGFDVIGGHTYSEEGNFTMIITVNDVGGAFATTEVVNNVADAALTANSIVISPVEGAAQPASTIVAHFTDADPAGATNDYIATIDWGDNTTSVGTIVANPNGGFDVQGGHTYAEEGHYTLSVQINDAGASAVTSTDISVLDAQLAANAFAQTVQEGTPLSNSTVVAHFSDADPGGIVSDFSALITWGDNTTSSGTIVANPNGGFDVEAGHTYADAGSYHMSVYVADVGGATVTTSDVIVSVSNAPIFVTANQISAVEGAHFSDTIIAHFVDENPDLPSDYNAVISWGDNSSSVGTVVANPNGGFDVIGNHTYQEEGAFSLHVTVTNAGTDFISSDVPASVSDAALTATANNLTSVEGSALSNNTVVAHFNDADPNGTLSDYTATIFWGDQTSTEGVIVSNPHGGFDVLGGHQYVEEGSYSLQVVINDAGGSTTSPSSTVTIDDAALSASANAFVAVEGNPTPSTLVGHFTDANPFSNATDFTAVINWGDGNSSQGAVVANANGGYDVIGSHTYSDEGTYNMFVQVNDIGGASTDTSNVQIVVADASLTATSLPLSAVEGAALSNNTLIAHFDDANPFGTISDFSATISWGDTTTSHGTIQANVNGGFDVFGSHTYNEEGSYNLNVTINDVGSATITTADTHVSVSDAPLAANATSINAVEGTPLPNDTLIAHFTDADPNGTLSDYSATISWGDNSSSDGTIVANVNGGFDVFGSHTYSETGSYHMNVTVSDVGGSTVTTADVVTNVSDAALSAIPISFTPTEGIALPSGTLVAHFTDANPGAPIADFTATIYWGDGTNSQGTINSNTAGGFDVTGVHTYVEEGNYNMHVVVNDVDGANAMTNDLTINVQDAPLAANAFTLSATEGAPVADNTLVGHFTDANPNADILDFTASINWGDGSSSNGTIQANVNGGFDVFGGGHTYSEEGNYSMHVTVNDIGGSSIRSSDVNVNVNDAALFANAISQSSIEGLPSANSSIVAHFTDNNPGANLSDFSAIINWGDGTTSQGTIQANANGGFDVLGGHTYSEEGSYSMFVAVSDVGGASVTTLNVLNTVHDAALSATSLDQAAVEGIAIPNNTLVAHFTDANPQGTLSDFSAVIDWGDGSTSAGTVSINANGGFDVFGGHTYSEEGNYSMTVNINDIGGSTITTSDAAVVVSDASLSANSLPLSSVEGAPLAANSQVAHFTDANPSAPVSDFTATINWGDGSQSSGSIVANANGGFDVFGGHTYTDEGNYNMHVTINDVGGAQITTLDSVVTVADAALSSNGVSLTSVEGNPLPNSVIAHFTDANAFATVSDFSASINWGDGSQSTGTVVANPNGGYDVIGGHTYAEVSSYQVSVSISDLGGASTSAQSSVAVSDAPLTATAFDNTGIEGNALASFVAAHFTDANPTGPITDFSATIDWGDNSSSTGQIVANVNGGFDVIGAHTYADEGSYNMHVTINDIEGATITTSDAHISVADATLNADANALSAVEGNPLGNHTVVAHFTDANPSAPISDFSATINWGDGTSTSGSIVANANGGFDVVGGHTYSEEGNYSLSVKVDDVGGSTITTSDASVVVGDAPLSANSLPLSGVEGAPLAANSQVAHFTDANPSAPVSDFSATIFWGDGSQSSGSIVANANGGFDVFGGHTYTDEGNYNMHVTINDVGGAQITTLDSVATVADAALSSNGVSLTSVEGNPLPNSVIAHFTDANAFATVSDFSASINWGDGSQSTGTVVANPNGGYDVIGGHTYAEVSSYQVSVSISDLGGASTSAQSSVAVSDAPLTATAFDNTGIEGNALASFVAAHFTDANPTGPITDFSATIDWGDNSSSTGQIVANVNGGFDVIGAHTYADEGSYNMHVTINDIEGATITTSDAHISVADATLNADANALSAVEGNPLGNHTVVAHFTDANPSAPASDFSATIYWGDGSNTSGTIVANANGGFDVVGGHTYSEEGNYSLSVKVDDVGGSTITTSDASVVVSDAPLSANSLPLSGVEGAPLAGNSQVAHFTDANPSAPVSDFSATIFWGDGSQSSGSIVANANGGFDVFGGHTYTDEGSYNMHVTINDVGGAHITTLDSVATVADAALSSNGVSLTSVEGNPLPNSVIAHFTDANAFATVSDFSASINWGDGTQSNGTVVANPNGGYDVIGGHTYAEVSSYQVNVSISDLGGASTSAQSSVAVSDAPLTATAFDNTGIEGNALASFVAAHFTDANPTGPITDFSATIDWGDNSSSIGQIVANVNGGFDVIGAHTYADEGSYNMHVTINDIEGATITTSDAHISVADAALNADANALSAVEGSPLGNNTVVAHFTDANPSAPASDFSATIYWGDGSNTSGTIVANANGGFDVVGGHTYSEEGNYSLSVKVNDIGGSTVTTTDASVVVSDAPLSANSLPLSGVEGAPLAANSQVAHFTDANPSAPVSDFSATIFWGDGSQSSGSIVANVNGGFDVFGGHTYTEEGNYNMHVTINDVGGAQITTLDSVATVTDAALSSNGVSLTSVEGNPLPNSVIAHFTDANAFATVSDFSASINWGDGTQSNGTVVANPNGGYDVIGGHTYAEVSSYQVNVSISDLGGASTSAQSAVAVSDAPLTATAFDNTGIEGNALASFVAAHFTDANPTGPVTDFTATIYWGDNSSSAGEVVVNPNGGFDVIGAHTYVNEGSYNMHVTINDTDGAIITTSDAQISIADASLTANAISLAAVEGNPLANNTVVAHFTDANPNAPLSDFSATIYWGDGSNTSGTIVANVNGGFDVIGAHTYGEEGTFSMYVNIKDIGSAEVTTSNATVLVADAPLNASSSSLTSIEGLALPNSTVVAHFVDANPNGVISDFTSLIHWGDGTISNGTIVTNPNGGFDVVGGHTYADEGSFNMSVIVNDIGGSSISISQIPVTVDDAPLTANSFSFSGVEGNQISSTVVAHFVDANPNGNTSDFNATIYWGDGTNSQGNITPNGNGFDIVSNHIYLDEGTYNMHVTINDKGGATVTTGDSQVTIADAPLTASINSFSPIEGNSTSNLIISHFTDANPLSTAADFNALIDWGDGNSSQGTIQANPNGGFDVLGSHIYDEGFYNMHVTINDIGGASVTKDASIAVHDAPLSSIAYAQSSVEGSPLSNTVVAHFNDANPLSTLSDFSAIINWGDGSQTNGTIIANANGGYDVQDAHTYLDEGNYSMTVVINDVGGEGSTSVATMVVHDAPLSSLAFNQSSVEGSPLSNNVIAHFNDVNPNSTISDFSAVINWGDGTSTNGQVVVNPSGGFDVTGSHIYGNFGSYNMHVNIIDTGGSNTIANALMNISDAPLTATSPVALNIMEGSVFNGVIASFHDGNILGKISDFTATINWGDGKTSLGTIQSLGNGDFNVIGDKVFAQTGNYHLTVAIQDFGGSHANTISQMSVSDAPLIASGQNFAVLQGNAFNGMVASFHDLNTASQAADFTVTINWGDGQTSIGTVTYDNVGQYIVSGSHTFNTSGNSPVNVEILDIGGSKAIANSNATVIAPPIVIPVQAKIFSEEMPFMPSSSISIINTPKELPSLINESQVFNQTINPSFNDLLISIPIPFEKSDRSNTVPAGENISGELFAPNQFSYRIVSSIDLQHTTVGFEKVSANIFEETDQAQAYTFINNIDIPLAPQEVPIDHDQLMKNLILGLAATILISSKFLFLLTTRDFEGVIANFESSIQMAKSNFNAMINWGDGASSEGIIQEDSPGKFSVHASHTYPDYGTYNADISIIGPETIEVHKKIIVEIEKPAMSKAFNWVKAHVLSLFSF